MSRYHYKATITHVRDADTFDSTWDQGRGTLGNEAIRMVSTNLVIADPLRPKLLYLDAPEMDSPEGLAAREFLVDLFNAWGNQVAIRTFPFARSDREKRDLYARYLAIVAHPSLVDEKYTDWPPTMRADQLLLATGHARIKA